MTDRLAELGALQYAVENLSTAGTNPNRLGVRNGRLIGLCGSGH